LHALKPRLDEEDLALALTSLNPAEARLFTAMQKRDQRHALEVAGRIRAQGVDDPDLIKAALLHDCGKGEVPVWLRIVKVVAPAFVRSAGSELSSGWRGSAYRLTHHAEIGARLVREAGAGDVTAGLIRGRVEVADEGRLALLMAADDAS
jgi:hypothetical protein